MLVLSVSNLSAWFCDAIGETEVRGDATEIFEDVLVLCTCVLCFKCVCVLEFHIVSYERLNRTEISEPSKIPESTRTTSDSERHFVGS